jgi:transposase-like protein
MHNESSNWGLACPLKSSPDLFDNAGFTDAFRKGHGHDQERYRPEEIIFKLRAIEVHIAKGLKAEEAARKEGITDQTYYRWRKGYGGLKVDQAKRLKELEQKNSRLKKLLAEAHLARAMLQEVASGNF